MSVIDIHFGVDQVLRNATEQKAAQSPENEKIQIEYSENENIMFEIKQIDVDSKAFKPYVPID